MIKITHPLLVTLRRMAMRRVILLIVCAVVVMGCRRTPPAEAPSAPVTPPPSSIARPAETAVNLTVVTPAEKAIADLSTTMQDKFDTISDQIDALQPDVEAARALTGRVNDLQGELRKTTTAIDTRISEAVTQLTEQMKVYESLFTNQVQALEERQRELGAQLDTFNGRVEGLGSQLSEAQRAQSRSEQQWRILTDALDQQTKLTQQVLLDNSALFPAVEHMGEREVGGILGMGQKPQLPDSLLIPVRNRRATRPTTSITIESPRP